MKNKVILFIAPLLLILLIFSTCKANVVVSPTEIYLNVDDNYVGGNTSKKITVTNSNSYNISVELWMEHPDIIEWMRPNRTLIENLSWITIEPSQAIIPSDASSDFYINFNIPNETKNQTYDKYWESWAAIKIESASENFSSPLKEGYLVRVYVDSPSMPEEPSSSFDHIFYDTLIAIAIAIVLTLFFYVFRRKKRNNE